MISTWASIGGLSAWIIVPYGLPVFTFLAPPKRRTIRGNPSNPTPKANGLDG